MQLARTDETDLLIPLYAGVHDPASWRMFLARLQRRAGADDAALLLAHGDVPVIVSSGGSVGDNMNDMQRLAYDRLRAGRVYPMAELIANDPEFRALYHAPDPAQRRSDERIIRVRDTDGASAWLRLTRFAGLFSATDGALMMAVAPHIANALHSFALTQRLRLADLASREGLARAGVGWIALGRDARIIAIDPALAPVLRDILGSDVAPGERLPIAAQPVRHALRAAARSFADDAHVAPRCVILSHEPWLEALLVPIPDRPDLALARPVMLAYCRMARQRPDRRAMLSDLFGLSPREAELAQAMADGHSIAGAAAIMGLTLETARSYSKSIYAKMDVSGQPDMIRHMFLSSAALA